MTNNANRLSFKTKTRSHRSVLNLSGYFNAVLSINTFLFELYLRCKFVFLRKGLPLRLGDRNISNVEGIHKEQLLYYDYVLCPWCVRKGNPGTGATVSGDCCITAYTWDLGRVHWRRATCSTFYTLRTMRSHYCSSKEQVTRERLSRRSSHLVHIEFLFEICILV